MLPALLAPVPLLAQDAVSAQAVGQAGGWLFGQPTEIVIAVLAAGAACLGLWWFAKLHERTMTAATADMKAATAAMCEAFTRDQARDNEVFAGEQQKNRELILTILSQRTATAN